MHVHLRRLGAVASLAVGIAIVAPACVKDESSLIAVGCLTVPHDACTVQASTNSDFDHYGTIDAAYAAEYHCMVLLENQLVQRGDPQTLKTETSRIEVYLAEVQVLNNDPNHPTAYTKYSVPVSGHADPAVGTSPGIGTADVVALDNATLKMLGATAASMNTAQQVVSSIVLHARTAGGQELTSNELKFPISVFSGASCAVPSNDTCYAPKSSPATQNCRLGQDEPVDCRSINVCDLVCQDSIVTPGTKDYSTATCPNAAPASGGFGPCCG